MAIPPLDDALPPVGAISVTYSVAIDPVPAEAETTIAVASTKIGSADTISFYISVDWRK